MTSGPPKKEIGSPSPLGDGYNPIGGRGHNREDSGSSPSPPVTSRPGSAEARPTLATTNNHTWNSHRDRIPSPGLSQNQLPGIHSILNGSRDVDQIGVPWQGQKQYYGGQSARYHSPTNSHRPSNAANESRGGYTSSETRQDGLIQASPDRQPDPHFPYGASMNNAMASPNLTAPDNWIDSSSPKSLANQEGVSPGTTAASSTVPYYVRTQDIPGQGISYVYSDGSTCKAVINGKPVRAEWGVTKLGAPRKRQAEACIACRTKKIKCDRVGLSPSCAHCTKQNIECQWAARSSGTSSEPDDESQYTTESLEVKNAPGSAYGSRVAQSPKRSPTPRLARVNSTSDVTPTENSSEEQFFKRPRLATHGSDPSKSWEYPTSRGTPILNIACDKPEIFDTGTDPFVTSPEIAVKLLNQYFDYREHHLAAMFPRRSFTRWCFECKTKRAADRMILYAILALGSMFSTSVELKSISQHLADLARQLEYREFSKFSLQLAQTRLHLTFYNWAKGYANHAFEYTGAACRTLSALGYNTEEGCHNDICYAQAENDFEFSQTELIECRRRTFWCGYITERYNGYCSGHVGLFHNQDVWVAVPNREADYQSGVNAVGPLFNNSECDLTGCGGLAFLAGIVSIWGDVTADIYRSIYRSKSSHIQHYASFYAQVNKRIAAWEAALPSHFKLCTENTLQNIKDGCFVPYYLMHASHLITGMKINRYGYSDGLPTDHIRRNVRLARRYAHLLLELVSTVAKSDALPFPNRSSDFENAIHQPFPCYAILGACDILSSRGITSALSESQSQLGHAKTVVSECARFFNSAKQQKRMIDSRLSELGAHVAMKYTYSNRPNWRFAEAMEKTFIPKEMDLIYTVDDEVYFGALDEDLMSPEQPA